MEGLFMKSLALWVLSLVMLVIGVLSFFIPWFGTNVILSIIETVLGAAGVVLAITGKK
jgi:hypothetical protein